MVPVDADRVLVRSGLWTGQSYTLSDDSKKGKLSLIMDRLSSGCTERQLVEAVGKELADDVHSLLDTLSSHLIIEAVPRGAAAPDGDAPGLSLTSSFGAQPGEDLLAKLSTRKLIVWGLGGVGSRVALQLAELGVASLTLVDSRPYSAEETPFAISAAASAAGGTQAAVLAEALSRAFPGTPVAAADEDKLEPLLGKGEGDRHLVVTAESPVLSRFHAANKLALASGITWTAATIDGTEAMIGPTFIPGQTACYTCFELRLEANLVEYDAYCHHRDFSLTVPGRPRRHVGAVLDLAAGYLGYDLFRLLTLGHGLTQGRYIRLNLTYGAVELNDVLRLPRCPDCGKAASGRPNAALFYTLDKVVEEVGI